MNSRSYWLAFGIGVVSGATVALLYAPQSGARTRKQLRRGVQDAGDYVENAGDYLKAQGDRLSTEAQRALVRAKDHVGGVVDKASDVMSEAVKSAQSLV